MNGGNNIISAQYITNISDEDATYDNLSRNSIRTAVAVGRVSAEKYVLLYLYDKYTDNVTEKFFNEYGARLNNRLKSDVPLFTVYKESTYKSWENNLSDSAREALSSQFIKRCGSTNYGYDIMKKLAESYRVRRLPALVVINAKGMTGGHDIFTSKSFEAYDTAETVFNKITEVLDAMDRAPNDFEGIINICEGNCETADDFQTVCARCDPDSLYNFLTKHIRESNETQEACASAIGISRRTLCSYMNGETRIKLKTAYALAFHFHLMVEELEWIIFSFSDAKGDKVTQWTLHRRMEDTDEVKAVVHCLEKGMGISEAAEYFEAQGLDSIL